MLPGEGLAIIDRSAQVKTWGEADSPSPLGNMAKVLWLRLEAAEWEPYALETKCKGEINGVRCTKPKGHGRVDVPKSFREDCNAAFGVWVNLSREKWKDDYGEGGARHRFLEVFGPFLGDRLPKGPALPEKFGTEWFADGQLLLASPAQLAQWLAKPAQEGLLPKMRSYLLGFRDFAIGTRGQWWIKAFESAALHPPGQGNVLAQAWVLGGDSSTTVVFRPQPGVPPKEAQARFMVLMGVKK